MKTNQHYTATILVDQTPEQAFNAINRPRDWWSQAIEGDTDKLGSEFKYRYEDVHRCSFKITEFVPGQRMVWHVLDNYFDFVQDKTEWKGTDVVFEIASKGGKTEIRFTHVGLTPAYECFDICSNAWGSYITSSLRDLIATGKGQPNPLKPIVAEAREASNRPFTTSFVVDQSPEEVFAAVNNVRGWWSEEIEGDSDKLGGEFKFHYRDFHRSTQKITEFVRNHKIVWHVSEARINFVENKTEWNGTDIVFEITKKGDKTELRFTHIGLVPAIQCYGDCSGAWGFYINESLRDLITTGKGQPARPES